MKINSTTTETAIMRPSLFVVLCTLLVSASLSSSAQIGYGAAPMNTSEDSESESARSEFASYLHDMRQVAMLNQQQEIMDWLSQAEGCEACIAMESELGELLGHFERFQEDLNLAFSDYDLKSDSVKQLMGRLDIESLLLAYHDLVRSTEIESLPSYREVRDMPMPRPGVYHIKELRAWKQDIADLASYRKSSMLNYYESQLDELQPKPVIIVPAALNLLYSGVENPLRIAAGNADPASIRIEGPGASQDADGNWIVKPEAPGKLMIKLHGTDAHGKAIYGEAEFEVRRVPDPIIYVGGREDGVIIKKLISNQSGVVARNDDFLYTVGYNIRGFEMVYTPEYGSPISARTPGNKFSDEMISTLKKTKVGDRLLFRVTVEKPDGSTKVLSPVYYVR